MSALRACGVTVAHGDLVLTTGLDVVLGPGDALVVTGGMGSGKSSVLRVLAGLDPPAAGFVEHGGPVVVTGDGPDDDETPRAWLAAAPHQADWQTLLDAAGFQAGALDLAGIGLSRGALQRVALVDAFARPAALLVLDEPAAGLDVPGRAWLRDVLAQRRASGTAVVVTDPDLAAAATAMLDLGDGGW